MRRSSKISVNVSLCGSIPRCQMNLKSTQLQSSGHHHQQKKAETSLTEIEPSLGTRNSIDSNELPLTLESTDFPNIPSKHVISDTCAEDISESLNPIQRSMQPHTQAYVVDPPAWAVRARGDARLEPVGDSRATQSQIDLTTQSCYRIGRSHASDVQLLHSTSSRRHAILFHHPNGSCYVVDCGSAHGTYVNGVRVCSRPVPSLQDGKSHTTTSGMVVPHRVKRGGLIRFGGPGAPSFVLKSFAVGLDTLLQNFDTATKKDTEKTNNQLLNKVNHVDDSISSSPSLAPVKAIILSEKERLHYSHSAENLQQSAAALLALNTRLNALGCSPPLLKCRSSSSPLFNFSTTILKKRARHSFRHDINNQEMHPSKKLKSNSLLREPNLSNTNLGDLPPPDPAVVSPTRKELKVTLFDLHCMDRAVVSPNPLEEAHQGPAAKVALFQPPHGFVTTCPPLLPRGILTLPSPKSHQKTTKCVKFCDEGPQTLFFPSSVTPDTSSDEEEEFEPQNCGVSNEVMLIEPRTPRAVATH